MSNWGSDRFKWIKIFDRIQFQTALHKVAPFYLLKPLSMLINFITIAQITSMIGVDGYGAISLILAATAFITAVIDFRSNESVVRFRVRYQNANDPGSANFSVLLGAGIDAGLALIYPIVIFILADPISSHFFHGQIAKKLLIIYSISSSFLFLAGTPSAILQSCGMFWKLSSADLLHKSIRLAWVLLASSPISVRYVIFGYALSNILYSLTLAVTAIHTLRRDTRGFPVHASRKVVKDFTTFTTHTFISSLLKAGITDVDKLVLGYFCQTRDVGLYDIVKRIAGLLSWIIFPLGTVTYPSFVQLFQNRQYMEIKLRIRKITLVVTFASLTVAIFVLMTRSIVQQFFSISGFPVLHMLIPLLICNTLQNTLWFSRVFVNSIGEPHISVWLNGIMSALSIISLVFLVPLLNVDGAALANLLSMFVIFLLWSRYYLSKTRSWS
ncbi:MAG: oligosaccharide flippase family protein [Geobacter sp.]|nr:oligosaccharide flippase family protein [Geobacter sp.]